MWIVNCPYSFSLQYPHKTSHQIKQNTTVTSQDFSNENSSTAFVVVAWCRFNGEGREGWSEGAFHVAFFVSSYAIPLVLIVLLYIGMLQRHSIYI